MNTCGNYFSLQIIKLPLLLNTYNEDWPTSQTDSVKFYFRYGLLGNKSILLFFYLKRYHFGDKSLDCGFLCKYFLPFCGLSFRFVCGFLCCAKAFKFNQVPFVYFCFYFHYSRRWIQKDTAVIYIKECSMFSSKSLIVSGLTFRSLIHFDFIFVYGVRECSNLILLHVAIQFSQHHLLKTLSFLHCIFSPPLSYIN